MKTHYTFEPGDRVIGPYGAGVVEKVRHDKLWGENFCLVAYDGRYGYGTRTPVEETSMWHPNEQLKPAG